MRSLLLLSLLLGVFPSKAAACSWDVTVTDEVSHEVKHYSPGSAGFPLSMLRMPSSAGCQVSPIRDNEQQKKVVGLTCFYVSGERLFSSTITAISVNHRPTYTETYVTCRPVKDNDEAGYSISIECS